MGARDFDEQEFLSRYLVGRDALLNYARDCLKIRTKADGIRPLAFNRAQLYAHKVMEDQRERTGKVRAIVLKARQQGLSTYSTARHFRRAATEAGRRAYILTHEQKATDNLFEMVRRYHEHLPQILKPTTIAASAKELKFGRLDSGYVVGTAGAQATGRSGTYDMFLGSEVAFWQNADDHMAGVGQTVPDREGTEVILESTANGIGNMFHGTWQGAIRGMNEFVPVFVPWFWSSEYRKTPPTNFTMDADESAIAEAFGLDEEQIYWRRMKIATDFRGKVEIFRQEYPATPEEAFMSSGDDTLITPLMVMRARNCEVHEDLALPLLMGIDVAEYGDDRTAFAYRRGRYGKYPVQYFSKKSPMQVAGLAAIEIERRKPAAVMVDVGGVGSGVADRLIEMGYPIIRVNFGESAFEDERFANRRCEMWGECQEWLNNQPAGLPDDDALQSDLTGPTYTFDSSRRLKLESKETMKRRGLRSPDGGDAFCLTFAHKFGYAGAGRGIDRSQDENNWRVM